jgi:hypothetical protein
MNKVLWKDVAKYAAIAVYIVTMFSLVRWPAQALHNNFAWGWGEWGQMILVTLMFLGIALAAWIGEKRQRQAANQPPHQTLADRAWSGDNWHRSDF